MPKQSLVVNNKPKHTKVLTPQYIKNSAEPGDNTSHDTLAGDETVLAEQTTGTKQRLRVVAQKIRRIKSFKKAV